MTLLTIAPVVLILWNTRQYWPVQDLIEVDDLDQTSWLI
ncbi:hypothetical protein FHS19_003214 [Paenibacillus rhizosphaerae]|uniref:Uncharacterized protein n=1 Tax=Paenibacillus rhizosphaerae TaxID=297318 RepID=A0A839TSC2_9BACL|nr:hypothetical protein [Paenibacillus rhizosphaerae]